MQYLYDICEELTYIVITNINDISSYYDIHSTSSPYHDFIKKFNVDMKLLYNDFIKIFSSFISSDNIIKNFFLDYTSCDTSCEHNDEKIIYDEEIIPMVRNNRYVYHNITLKYDIKYSYKCYKGCVNCDLIIKMGEFISKFDSFLLEQLKQYCIFRNIDNHNIDLDDISRSNKIIISNRISKLIFNTEYFRYFYINRLKPLINHMSMFHLFLLFSLGFYSYRRLYNNGLH